MIFEPWKEVTNNIIAQINASGRFPPLSSKHSEIPLKFNHRRINASHQISKLLKHLRHNNCTCVSTNVSLFALPSEEKIVRRPYTNYERCCFPPPPPTTAITREMRAVANYNFGINTGRSPQYVLLNRNWTKSTLRRRHRI
jgi:hypothetical protein